MFDPDDGRADAVDVLQVSVQLAKYRTVQYSTVQYSLYSSGGTFTVPSDQGTLR